MLTRKIKSRFQLIQKTLRLFIVLIIITPFFLACNSDQNIKNNISNDSNSIKGTDLKPIDKQVQKVIKLNNNIEIKVGQKYGFDNFNTYTLLILKHNDNVVYIDTSDVEYEFENKLYPILNIIDHTTFEILIEINNRPSKNYLKYLKIMNDTIIAEKKLPTFITKPLNLDKDDNLEYAGFWDFNEVWGNNNSLTNYNPILFYEVTKTGMMLDSNLTIMKNISIYGKFKGFEFSDEFNIPVSSGNKFSQEIERIENLGK